MARSWLEQLIQRFEEATNAVGTNLNQPVPNMKFVDPAAQEPAAPPAQPTLKPPPPPATIVTTPKLRHGVPMAVSSKIAEMKVRAQTPDAAGNVAPSAYWPVRDSSALGRFVNYLDEQNKFQVSHSDPRHRASQRIAALSFAEQRQGENMLRHHAGVDILAKPGSTIVACEAGTVVGIMNVFYTTKNGIQVGAIFIQHDDMMINYGEILSKSWEKFGITKGSRVCAGQEIATVAKMDDGGMCHFETYKKDVIDNDQWQWNKPAPAGLLNSTAYLLELAMIGA